jgi:signal transduction histidine kinase
VFESALTGPQRVALLGGVVAACILALLPLVNALPISPRSMNVPWYVLAPLFAVAELAVVHFRFRRDAHSFSLSDVPMVLGMFLAGTVDLVAAVVVGNLFALTIVRRQRGLKLFFNVVAFAAQAVVAHAVFKLIVGPGDPIGLPGWIGAFAGTWAAFAVADALVTGAIRLTGGVIRPNELAAVVVFGLVAGSINAGLALLLVTIFLLHPESAWLAMVPTFILFIAYRAYTDQRDERARIEALYEMTLTLHAAPLIEDAVSAAATGARELFEAETAYVLLASEGPLSYRTIATAGNVEVMTPIVFDRTRGAWPDVLVSNEGAIMRVTDPNDWDGLVPAPANVVMVAPLLAGDRHTGMIMVADPLSEVGQFNQRDLKILETLAGRLGVSLENGRLEDSLSEVTRLKERLEELVASKDQFIASVSHELRTPLTGIVGLAQELRNNRDLFGPEELDEFLGHIYEQSTEMGNIIEDLLIAARADIGTLVVKPTTLDVAEALAPVLVSHTRKAASKTLDTVPRGESIAVEADGLRLRQIVRNLLTNAVRYGGSNIWVEVASRGGMVEVSVVDDGEGVPPESLEEIFQPYGRAAGGQANPSSVGLGLSVSLQLARLMGGDLQYRRRGSHTCFVVSLPKARAGALVAEA